jgi:hypothetical protein
MRSKVSGFGASATTFKSFLGAGRRDRVKSRQLTSANVEIAGFSGGDRGTTGVFALGEETGAGSGTNGVAGDAKPPQTITRVTAALKGKQRMCSSSRHERLLQ